MVQSVMPQGRLEIFRFLLIIFSCCWLINLFYIYWTVPNQATLAVINDTKRLRPTRELPGDVPLPPMGWNSWNAFGCRTSEITEMNLKATIDILVESGLASAGYRYFNIDDCWLDPEMTGGGAIKGTRSKAPRQGALRADPLRFTNASLAALASYAHDSGLLFGTYLDAGDYTCEGYGGSLGHEKKDASVLAEWEVDFLKLDGCYMQNVDSPSIYKKWSKLLRRTGRKIVFSCSYPAYADNGDRSFPESFDWEGVRQICNMWRLYKDVAASWSSIVSIMDYWATHESVLRIYHEPNGYNDPDMLEGGNVGITIDEGKTQLSVWSILAAPLILGNDLQKMTSEEIAAFSNEEVIEVNQDPLVKQGRRIFNRSDHSIWLRILHDNSVVLAVINMLSASKIVGFCWEDVAKYFQHISPLSIVSEECSLRVRDLWKRTDLGRLIFPIASSCLYSPSTIPSHGTFLIRVWFDTTCYDSPIHKKVFE